MQPPKTNGNEATTTDSSRNDIKGNRKDHLKAKATRSSAVSTMTHRIARTDREGTKALSTASSDLPPILRLPPDVLHYLLTLSCRPHQSKPSQPWLTYPTLLALRLTHPHFACLLTPAFVASLRSLLVSSYLDLEAQQHALWLTTLTPHKRWLRLQDAWFDRPTCPLRCYRCLEVKPLTSFTARHARRGMGLGGRQGPRRWCKACLVEGGRVAQGRWEKENWVQRGDLVRSRSRSKGNAVGRLLSARRTPKVVSTAGVCAKCRATPYELWWGCVGCFEREERRRQEQDRMGLGPMRRTVEVFREAKGKWWRLRGPARQGHWVWIWQRQFWRRGRDILISWTDWSEWERGEILLFEEDDRLDVSKDYMEEDQRAPGSVLSNAPSRVKADRREIRCATCWTPNCPRRRWVLGMAYERPLPKERWCEECHKEAGRDKQKRCPVEDGELVDGLGLGLLFGA